MRVLRKFVSSSAVRSVGYDDALHILEVEYISGDVYRYSGVPRRAYERLSKAPSKGTYVNREIKPKFPYAKAA
jgi:hypothetical protein